MYIYRNVLGYMAAFYPRKGYGYSDRWYDLARKFYRIDDNPSTWQYSVDGIEFKARRTKKGRNGYTDLSILMRENETEVLVGLPDCDIVTGFGFLMFMDDQSFDMKRVIDNQSDYQRYAAAKKSIDFAYRTRLLGFSIPKHSAVKFMQVLADPDKTDGEFEIERPVDRKRKMYMGYKWDGHLDFFNYNLIEIIFKDVDIRDLIDYLSKMTGIKLNLGRHLRR